MKRTIIALFMGLTIVLTACGGESTESINKSTAETSSSISEVTPEPVQEVAPEVTEDVETDSSAVDPELKEFLDAYEEFTDEYCEFMKKYNDADTSDLDTLSELLDDYSDYMKKANEFSEKADKYDTDNMSTADVNYYIDVTTRIQKKMLGVLEEVDNEEEAAESSDTDDTVEKAAQEAEDDVERAADEAMRAVEEAMNNFD